MNPSHLILSTLITCTAIAPAKAADAGDAQDKLGRLVELIEQQSTKDGVKPDISHLGNSVIVTSQEQKVNPAVVAKLEQRVSVDFEDTPIDEVVTFLRSISDVNFVLAANVIANAAETRVTLKADKMRLASVLNWVESMTKLKIGFVSGALYVSDQPIAGTTTTRVFDVSDLVMPIPDFPGKELAYNQAGGADFDLFK